MTTRKTVSPSPTASPAKPALRRAPSKTAVTKASLPAAGKVSVARKTPARLPAVPRKTAVNPAPAARTAAVRKPVLVHAMGGADKEMLPGQASRSGMGFDADPDSRHSDVVGAAAGSIVTLTEASQVVRKPRPVRHSFTMSEAEYALLGRMKQACLGADYEVKKSELLRVGIALVAGLDTVTLKDLLVTLAPVKPGRAKKA